MDAGARATQEQFADDCMDAGARATQEQFADDCMDAGARATQEQFAEFTDLNHRLSRFLTRYLSKIAFVQRSRFN